MKRLFSFYASGPDRPVIENREIVDKLYKHNRISIMLAITLGYGFSYTCRLALSVVKKPLIDGGIFSAEELGVIGSGIFYGYAFGKLINGFLADHSNIKKFLATGILCSAMMNLAMGWTATLWVWIVLWMLNGWFQGFGAPAGIVALTSWFSASERGRYYGIWSTAHSLGEGLTFIVFAAVVNYFGWRFGFWGPGIFCTFVAVGMYLLLQDRPQTLGLPSVWEWKADHDQAVTDTGAPKEKTLKIQLRILKMPAIWILGLSSATMYMTRYAINSWGILYLQEAKGYSLIKAGGMLGVNTFAGIAGCLAYGFASDKIFKARRPPMNLICAVIEILALTIIFFAPPGHPVLITVAFAMYGFALNGLVTALGGLFAVDIAPRGAAGAALGFIGVFSYLGAALQERISGLIIEHGTTIVDGVRHYDFSKAIYFWIGSSVISLLLAATLWRAKVQD